MPKAKREEEPPFTVGRGGAIAGRGSVDFVVLDICATLSVIPCGDAFRIDVGVFACVCTVHKCIQSQRKPKCLRSCSIRYYPSVSLSAVNATLKNSRRDSTPSFEPSATGV